MFQILVYFCVKAAPTWKISPPSKNCDHVKPPPSCFLKIWLEIQLHPPSRNGEVHTVFLTYSTCWSLKNQWFLGFNCILLIIKIAGLETSRPTFFGEKFGIISWNRLIIFNGDMKCVLLISFLVQNLITSDNPISMWLWWIWNSAFWLEVENLRKVETMVSYKPLPSLSQENRKILPSALLDTSTT